MSFRHGWLHSQLLHYLADTAARHAILHAYRMNQLDFPLDSMVSYCLHLRIYAHRVWLRHTQEKLIDTQVNC